jgi:hypothetical protein
MDAFVLDAQDLANQGVGALQESFPEDAKLQKHFVHKTLDPRQW